jgi:serpin B
VLLNAVYFLGKWTTAFEPAATRPGPFATAGGPVQVPMMHLRDKRFGLAERDGYRMLRLPYGEDERYGMEILLPDEDTTLAAVLGDLDAAEWRAAVAGLTEQAVDELALPRFELRWKGGLGEALQGLGMRTAFSPAADFAPMSEQAPSLAQVLQKTYIKVDEHGTEAAAVTGGVMVMSAPATTTTFRVDRPFAFTISDRETGTVLFLGSVADPLA